MNVESDEYQQEVLGNFPVLNKSSPAYQDDLPES